MTYRGKELGSAELEILNVLWAKGPSTVRDVLSELHEQGRTLAYNTVQTYLVRLEQKGCVASDRRELAYVYRSKVSRETMRKTRVHSLIQQMFDGVPSALALRLIESERFSTDEIEQLRQMLDKLAAEDARKSKRRKSR